MHSALITLCVPLASIWGTCRGRVVAFQGQGPAQPSWHSKGAQGCLGSQSLFIILLLTDWLMAGLPANKIQIKVHTLKKTRLVMSPGLGDFLLAPSGSTVLLCDVPAPTDFSQSLAANEFLLHSPRITALTYSDDNLSVRWLVLSLWGTGC